MNEFIEQFLIEARDLVAQATDDLLALEQQPKDEARLDGAFRAFHTLKGAAGIVDFEPMIQAMHAAEDLLSAARAGTRTATPVLISDALTALDQVVQWLDEMEASGDVPVGAEPAAQAIVDRLGDKAIEVAETSTNNQDWAQRLASSRPDLTDARTAIRYRPAEDSFFRGDDPLARLADIPGLLSLVLRPTRPWPSLAELDPYACQLEMLALSSAAAGACEIALQDLATEVDVASLHEADAYSDLTPLARDLLQAQLDLLADPTAEATGGRLGSAARVVENLLRSLRRDDEAAAFAQNAASWTADLDVERLRAELQAIASGAVTEGAQSVELRQGAEPTARALRVEVERIDALVNLTGELAVAKNALGHLVALADGGADAAALAPLLKSQHATLDRLVQQVQAQVLNIRVLPMRHVFQRFPRLVREISASLGKPARLVIDGDETEADKAIVESLFEPLLHVIRNALDHGVEPSETRAAAGKSAVAVIRLSARREGGHVVVEVSDDGRGIDLSRVRRLAVDRGLLDPAAAETLSETDTLELIFAPGFSTAGEVTQFSGRGVGMDAVRTAVTRLGGRVGIESAPGEGSRVRLILPFTVLMTRILTVEAGGQRFGVPLEAVVETIRIPTDRLSPVGQARAFVHRERTLPVISLAEALGGAPEAQTKGEVDIVVAVAAGQTIGVEVARVGERMEVMLKPLDGLMASTPGLAGATLMGDGQVLLILDLQELLP